MATSGNWTEREMRAQVEALAEQIEIAVLNANGRMTRRRGGLEELVYLVPWLIGRNRQGAHIYVRPWVPAGAAGVILVDDLTADALRQMGADGLMPVAVVETSPNNHQAWVRVSSEPLATELATAVARVVARRYGGDMNSAAANHLGRLAGFTNPKERYRDASGRFPWVRVRRVQQAVALAADAVLVEAAGEMRRAEGGRIERLLLRDAEGGVSELGQRFCREVTRLCDTYGYRDWSRVEWMVVLDMARRYPEASPETLGRALFEAGQITGLAARKRGHLLDYISRTVQRAQAHVARERAGGQRPGRVAQARPPHEERQG